MGSDFQKLKKQKRLDDIEIKRLSRQDPQSRNKLGLGTKRPATQAPVEEQQTSEQPESAPEVIIRKDHIDISPEAMERYKQESTYFQLIRV